VFSFCHLGHRFLQEWLPLDVLMVFGHQNHQTLGELSQNDASMIINEEILKDKTLRRLDQIPKTSQI